MVGTITPKAAHLEGGGGLHIPDRPSELIERELTSDIVTSQARTSPRYQALAGVSIYSGQVLLGFILKRDRRWHTFDASGQGVADFPTLQKAVRSFAGTERDVEGLL
jgi:hypothetical protein